MLEKFGKPSVAMAMLVLKATDRSPPTVEEFDSFLDMVDMSSIPLEADEVEPFEPDDEDMDLYR